MSGIVRIAARRRYSVVPNGALEDARLSWKARGLLAYLLSKPDGWQVRSRHLETVGPDGRDSVRAGLRELEAAGYLRRDTLRDEAGRLSTVSTLYDSPAGDGDDAEAARSDDPEEGIAAGHTGDGLSGAGSSGAGKAVPLVTTEGVTTEGAPLARVRAREEDPGPDPDGDDADGSGVDATLEAIGARMPTAIRRRLDRGPASSRERLRARIAELVAAGWQPRQLADVAVAGELESASNVPGTVHYRLAGLSGEEPPQERQRRRADADAAAAADAAAERRRIAEERDAADRVLEGLDAAAAERLWQRAADLAGEEVDLHVVPEPVHRAAVRRHARRLAVDLAERRAADS